MYKVKMMLMIASFFQAECDDLREKLRAMADHEALLISYPDFHGPLERYGNSYPIILPTVFA